MTREEAAELLGVKSDASRFTFVPTKRDSMNVPQNVATVDTTRLTPPQQTRKDSVRVNPTVVRRDTAKPTPVFRRDTAKAPTVVTPTVTQREDHGGYGPCRWGMTSAEVRAIAVANHHANTARWNEDLGNKGLTYVAETLENADGLPDKDLFQPFVKCQSQLFLGVPRSFSWWFDGAGLSRIDFWFDRSCSGLDDLVSKMIARYAMGEPLRTTSAKAFHKASDSHKRVEVYQNHDGDVAITFKRP